MGDGSYSLFQLEGSNDISVLKNSIEYSFCSLSVYFLEIEKTTILLLIMTPEKQDRTSELSKHWSPNLTLARNVVIMKTAYPVNQ